MLSFTSIRDANPHMNLLVYIYGLPDWDRYRNARTISTQTPPRFPRDIRSNLPHWPEMVRVSECWFGTVAYNSIGVPVASGGDPCEWIVFDTRVLKSLMHTLLRTYIDMQTVTVSWKGSTRSGVRSKWDSLIQNSVLLPPFNFSSHLLFWLLLHCSGVTVYQKRKPSLSTKSDSKTSSLLSFFFINC